MAVKQGCYGLRPVGPIDPNMLREYTITAAADIFVGDPVEADSSGYIGLAAAANIDNLGVVMSVKDNTGKPAAFYDYSATTNTGWKAVVNCDPEQVYAIHYKFTTVLTASYIWNCVDWVAGTGDEESGLSGAYIGAAPSAAQASLVIIGILDTPDNSWDNAVVTSTYHYELLVKFNEMWRIMAGTNVSWAGI